MILARSGIMEALELQRTAAPALQQDLVNIKEKIGQRGTREDENH